MSIHFGVTKLFSKRFPSNSPWKLNENITKLHKIDVSHSVS